MHVMHVCPACMHVLFRLQEHACEQHRRRRMWMTYMRACMRSLRCLVYLVTECMHAPLCCIGACRSNKNPYGRHKYIKSMSHCLDILIPAICVLVTSTVAPHNAAQISNVWQSACLSHCARYPDTCGSVGKHPMRSQDSLSQIHYKLERAVQVNSGAYWHARSVLGK